MRTSYTASKKLSFATRELVCRFQSHQSQEHLYTWTTVAEIHDTTRQKRQVCAMENTNLVKKEFISVWVRDPQVHKEDFWNTHITYEICLHTNSMCFRKKTSCVRRRYSEFVWLRQKLQNNALLIELPKLPRGNPFFNLNSDFQITQRMRGLQHFLEAVLQTPLLLSDSLLHLFLQSPLSIAKMDACAQGQTHYTVAQAIQRCVGYTRFPVEEQHQEDDSKTCCDSDCERCHMAVTPLPQTSHKDFPGVHWLNCRNTSK
ncbi:sorting nexin-10A-like [Sinocyclocheilus grahami]|uniref:sorting nexin-10A-like n=1 Tax=Sinocyclocheilus grahami TaxID=75366 RepID=UPI0007AC7FA5|nr:PREDICTED: sorting nexin-10A-like [Sinocyclocheilus grahami]